MYRRSADAEAIAATAGTRGRAGAAWSAFRDAEERLLSVAPGTWSVAVGALALGIWALVIYMRADVVLAYGDAIGHLHVARRTVDSVTPSFSQLGTIWLPLQHVLMLPLIWNDTLWHNGLAGSIISLIAFAGGTVYAYRMALTLTGYGVAAALVAAIFATNPNMLYMQATPMSECLTVFFIIATAYHMLRFARDDSVFHLVLAAAYALGGSLTRFETWIFIPAGLGLVAVLTYRRHRDWRRVEAIAITWCVVAGYGVFLWLLYNQIIFGSAMAFTSGPGTGELLAQELKAAGLLETAGNPVASVTTYGWAALDNLGLPLALAGVAGMVALLAGRESWGVKLAALFPAAVFAFAVMSLVGGQNVLWTPHTEPQGFYNIRYGLLMLPAAVLAASYLARAFGLLGVGVLAAVLVPQLMVLPGPSLTAPTYPEHVAERETIEHYYVAPDVSRGWISRNFPLPHPDEPILLTEAALARSIGDEEVGDAADWLGRHVRDDEKVLMSEWHFASTVMMESGLDIRTFIHEGNKPHFEEERDEPGRRADWLVFEPDDPHDRLHGLLAAGAPPGFALVYDNGTLRAFRTVNEDEAHPRPDAVPSVAWPVQSETSLGITGGTSRVVISASECADGLLRLDAGQYNLYAQMPCDQAPTDAILARPLRISILPGEPDVVALHFAAGDPVTFAADAVWVAAADAVAPPQ